MQSEKQIERSGRTGEGHLVLRALILAGWMGSLLWLSLVSTSFQVPEILAWDKLQHGIAHAVLTLLAGWFFSALWRSEPAGWWSGLLLSLAFGILIEVAQGTLTTDRVADWHDLVANMVGAGSVFVIAMFWHRLKIRHKGD